MFLPDTIDLNKLYDYILSIRIKPDGFAYFIHEPDNEKAFYFHKTEFSNDTSLLNNVRRIILDDDDYKFLTDAFKQTNVVIASADYELMPDIIKEQQQLRKFYRFTHNEENVQTFAGEYSIAGCNLVFGMDDDLYSLLMRSLYNPVFHHHNGLQLKYFKKKTEAIRTPVMFVHFHDHFADLNCFDADGNILFAHTYYNEHHLNMVFHILSVWEKLGFNQLEHHLIVSGYYPDNRMETTLKEYIKLVRNDGLFEQLIDFGEKAQNIPLDLLILSA